jgi:hypothetical protein
MHPREQTFFEDPHFDANGFDAFCQQFDGHGPGITGFKRPDLLALPECPGRLARLLPDLRMIAVLRDPVRRAVAAYYFHMQKGRLPLLPVSRWLTQRAVRYPQLEPAECAVLEYGLYASQLERYREHFDARQMLVLLHEDLAGGPEEAMARTTGFLGLGGEFVPRPPRRRVNPTVYSLARLRLRVPMRRLAGGRAWQRPLGKLLNLADLLLRPFAARRAPQLTVAARQVLEEFYRDDVARLARLLERDLSAWSSA